MLRDLQNGLDAQFNNIFLNGTTGLAFLVSKPLVREVVLVDDDVPPLAADAGGDEEQDEAVENRITLYTNIEKLGGNCALVERIVTF